MPWASQRITSGGAPELRKRFEKGRDFTKRQKPRNVRETNRRDHMSLFKYGQIGPAEGQDGSGEAVGGRYIADVGRSQNFEPFRERLYANVLGERFLKGYRLLRGEIPLIDDSSRKS